MDRNIKKDYSLWIIIPVIVIFILLWILPYYLNFRFYEISDKPQDWANFSNYGVLFVGIINTIIIAFISYKLFITNRNFNELILKPIIIATHIETDIFKEKIICWNLQNGSSHTALNVIVRHYIKEDGNELGSKYIMCDSIAGKGNLLLFWVFNASKIEVYYSDMESKHFYLTKISNCSEEVEPINKDYYMNIKKLAFDTAPNGNGCTIARLTDIFIKYDNKVSIYEYPSVITPIIFNNYSPQTGGTKPTFLTTPIPTPTPTPTPTIEAETKEVFTTSAPD